MNCPSCKTDNTRGINTRPGNDGRHRWRRYQCLNMECAARFTTREIYHTDYKALNMMREFVQTIILESKGGADDEEL